MCNKYVHCLQGELNNGWKSKLNFPTPEEVAFAKRHLSEGNFRGWKASCADESIQEDKTDAALVACATETAENYDDVCPICLDDLAAGDCFTTACKHCFHTKCLQEWLSVLKSTKFELACPMCNQVLPQGIICHNTI